MKNKKILVAAIVLVVIIIAYIVFATSGITENDIKNLPTCGNSEAASAIECVQR
jgi:archaellin